LNGERKSNVRKGRIAILVIVVALAAGTGYRVYRLVTGKEGPEQSAASAVVVKVAPVEKGTIRVDIRLTGDVKAVTSVQVFPKCPGRLIEPTKAHLEKARTLYKEGAMSEEPLEKVERVDEGDPVQKGQIISVIDHENLDAQVSQARAALTTAQAQLKQAEVARVQAEKDRERIRNLQKEGAASKQALEKIEAEYENLLEQENVAKARVKQSEAALNQAQIQLGECFITAPIAGIISQKYLEIGDMAMVTRPIFAIMDVDKVEVTADLPQRYIGQVREGAESSIEVDAFPGRTFQGTITRISPVVNVVNRTAELEITVENLKHELKPGMFARVGLNIAEKGGVVVIPEAAVLRDGSEEYVFVVEENTARRRAVKLGLEEGPRVEVTEGLVPGEMLVTAGQQKISEGERVEAQK
jgi:RND family efflux transporter MFP subunit